MLSLQFLLLCWFQLATISAELQPQRLAAIKKRLFFPMENRGLRPTIGSHVAVNESLFVQIRLPFLLVAEMYQSPLEVANRALHARKLSIDVWLSPLNPICEYLRDSGSRHCEQTKQSATLDNQESWIAMPTLQPRNDESKFPSQLLKSQPQHAAAMFEPKGIT